MQMYSLIHIYVLAYHFPFLPFVNLFPSYYAKIMHMGIFTFLGLQFTKRTTNFITCWNLH